MLFLFKEKLLQLGLEGVDRGFGEDGSEKMVDSQHVNQSAFVCPWQALIINRRALAVC